MPGSRALPFDPIEEARRQWIDHGWDDAADGMAALTSIIRVEQILMSRIEARLKPFGLTFARYELLVLLEFSRKGALPLGKIGARLQVHPASVTNAVDRLEADGLVERIAHPGDGRTTLATITADGRRTARRATRTLNAEVFSDLGWSRTDLDALFRILRRLRKSSGDFT
jgi:DNA-binding MarR family transcriptional regulator